jgi:uncharacterized protein (DUF2384 family)
VSDTEPAVTRSNWRSRKADRPRLSSEVETRQSRVTQLAFTSLGGRDQAVSFLNEFNPTLQARPLDLAMATAEGYLAVEAAIGLLARESAGVCNE